MLRYCVGMFIMCFCGFQIKNLDFGELNKIDRVVEELYWRI